MKTKTDDSALGASIRCPKCAEEIYADRINYELMEALRNIQEYVEEQIRMRSRPHQRSETIVMNVREMAKEYLRLIGDRRYPPDYEAVVTWVPRVWGQR